ncbi:hypothetical protein C0993_010047, partial [Termitomyces sp. T159_Od127]
NQTQKMSQNPPLFLLPAEERFDGSNCMTFKIIMTEAICSQELFEYLTSTNKNPTLTPPNIDSDKKEVAKSLTSIPPASTMWRSTANPLV